MHNGPRVRSLAHLVPVGNETGWSNLLAVLIETDPSCVAGLFGWADGAELRVEREVKVDRRDRLDLLVHADGKLATVVEVKVLSGFGPSQLQRYREARPEAARFVVLYPGRLAVDMHRYEDWDGVTWEAVLTALAASTNRWVAETATAWRQHLDRAVPAVDSATRWNALNEGEDFKVAMRARMSWVFEQLNPPAPLDYDLVGSSAGVSWVARIWAEAAAEGYWVLAEAEERLNVRAYPKTVTATSVAPLGPTLRIFLEQTGVDTSRGFDWDYLHSLWPLMNAERGNWVRNPPAFKSQHDRAGWQGIVAKGAPAYLGIGYGEGQTRRSRSCMFGARFQLDADVTLGEVAAALNGTADLLKRMSVVAPPTATTPSA